MSRFVVWLVMLCGLLLVLAYYAKADEGNGWDELLVNEPQKAKVVFTQALNSNRNLADYEGLYQSELMLGEITEAYETLKEMVLSSEGSSLQGLLLLRLGMASDAAGKASDFYSFSHELAKHKDIDPYTSTVLGLVENKAYGRVNEFEKASEALNSSTRIGMVSRIVGPVDIVDNYGLNIETEIENNLLSARYKSFKNVKVDITGKIKLGSILPNDGNSGVAYLYLALDAKNEMKAALDIFSESICKVWVNGNLVSSTDLHRLGDVRSRNSRCIQLTNGKNFILIKAFRKDTLSVGLRSVIDGGILEGVTVLPFEESDWESLRLNRYSGRVFSQPYVPAFVKEIEKEKSIASAFWQNFYFEYTNNYEAGIKLNQELITNYPNSALINYTVGKYYKGYYNFYESRSRSMVMCEKSMREALKIYPNYILPKLALIQVLLNGKQESMALKLLKEVMEQNAGFPLVYRSLIKLYMSKGWIGLAGETLEKYYELYPDSVVDVIKTYLDMGEFSKVEELLAKAKVENKLPLFMEYDFLMKMNRPELAEKVLEEWYKYYQSEKDTYLAAKVRLGYYAGDYKEVEKYLRLSLDKNPNNAGIMESLGINSIRMGDLKSGNEWFTKAHATSLVYKPSMPTLLERIEVDSSSDFELAKYDIPLEQIETLTVKKEDHDRASFANLVKVRVVRVFSDLSFEGFEHYAFKIFGNEGISKLAELNVGRGSIIECRTIAPNGEVFIPESSENLSLDKAISMYNVSVGSVIEYSKRVVGDSVAQIQDGFEFESYDNPVIRSRYVIILPKKLFRNISITGPEPEFEINGEEIILTWDEMEKSGVEPENFMPKAEEAIDNVRVTIYSGKPEAPGVITVAAPRLTLDEINRTAQEICRDSKSTRQKVAVIYKWIAENIQINNEAKSARDTYLLKGGTADSRAKLMMVMLEAVGVESYPLWSNIPFSIAGRLDSEDRVKSVGEFTLPIILRIENEESLLPDIWVKVSDDMRDNRPENIGTLALGALAIESSPFGVRLSAVRENELEGVSVIAPKIKILANGAAEVSGGVKFYGSSAASPRKVFYNSKHAQQYAAQVASQIFPRIINAEYTYPTVQELSAGLNNWEEPLVLTINGTVMDYCINRGDELYINPLNEGEFVRNLIVKEPRIHPIDIQMDVQSSVSKSFVIPEGYVYSNVPDDRVIKSSFGMFILDYNVEGKHMVVSGSLLIPAQKIKPDDCKLYNEFLSTVKEAVGQGVSIAVLQNNFGEEIVSNGVVKPVLAGRFYVKDLPENIERVVVEEGKK